MTESVPLLEQSLALIDQIVWATLKGKISSSAQVYRMLLEGVSPGTGEIFERGLSQQLADTQAQIKAQTDELKLAKANRILRALQTIQTQWERVQANNQEAQGLRAAVEAISGATPEERLSELLQVLDPNRPQVLSSQLKHLAKALGQQAAASAEQTDIDAPQQLQELSEGLVGGLAAWQRLEPHLVSWMYQRQGQLGFEEPGRRGPWDLWAKQVQSPLAQGLFQALARQQPIEPAIAAVPNVTLKDWVELVIILQSVQRGLIGWFDKMIYDAKLGSKLSISTFLVFAVIWSQLATSFNQHPTLTEFFRRQFAQGCFQVTLQLLRTFTQREYFPLYGGIFAAFGGEALWNTLRYLDQPLRQVEGTQEKARVLTLLGYSLRAQGHYQQARSFHQQALVIAREAGDIRCEIANLNHLSRIEIAQKNYAQATADSQRALMLSRQTGERPGEANALANLGYSQVLATQNSNQEPEVLETAIGYLEQGLKLSQQLQDAQSQALCWSSLGIAQLVLGQPEAATVSLEAGWQAAQFSGDLYLQGLNLAYLSQAFYRRQQLEPAIYTGCLGMYLLEQIEADEWRQPARLLLILQGQLGSHAFETLLKQSRAKILPLIGVDGYDHIPQLLARYQDSL